MPRRELQALGLQNNSSRLSKTRSQEEKLNQNDPEVAQNQNNASDKALEQQNAADNNNLKADQPKEEVFEFHPYPCDISPATSEGKKSHLKAIEAPPSDQKLTFSIETRLIVRNTFEILSNKFAWGSMIGKMPDATGKRYNVLKKYNNLSRKDVLKCDNTYLGNGNFSEPSEDRIVIDLDPANNIEHRRMFCMSVKSRIIWNDIEA